MSAELYASNLWFPVSHARYHLDLPALAAIDQDWGRELGFQQVGISGLDLAEHEQHLQRSA